MDVGCKNATTTVLSAEGRIRNAVEVIMATDLIGDNIFFILYVLYNCNHRENRKRAIKAIDKRSHTNQPYTVELEKEAKTRTKNMTRKEQNTFEAWYQ
jgi:hypothetical protein